MPNAAPTGYRASQITLHWIIAALVLFQLLFGGAMENAVRAARRGEPLTGGEALGANLHIWVGFAVLGLVLVRILLRLRHGAPALPEATGAVIGFLGRASHFLFYVLLVLAPVSGIVAYYFVPEAGNAHRLFKPAFVLLIALHVAASLWHQFIRRDGLLLRMIRPA